MYITSGQVNNQVIEQAETWGSTPNEPPRFLNNKKLFYANRKGAGSSLANEIYSLDLTSSSQAQPISFQGRQLKYELIQEIEGFDITPSEGGKFVLNIIDYALEISAYGNLDRKSLEHAPIVVEIRGNPSKPILSYSLLYVNTLSYRIKGTDEGGNHPVPVNSIKPLLSFK